MYVHRDVTYNCENVKEEDNVLCDLVIKEFQNSVREYERTGFMKQVSTKEVKGVPVKEIVEKYGIDVIGNVKPIKMFDRFLKRDDHQKVDEFKEEFESYIFEKDSEQ